MRIHRAAAAVASAILPGVGQILQGRFIVGLTQLVAAIVLLTWWTSAGGALVLRRVQQSPNYHPSGEWWLSALALIVVALWSIVDAARQKSGTDQTESESVSRE